MRHRYECPPPPSKHVVFVSPKSMVTWYEGSHWSSHIMPITNFYFLNFSAFFPFCVRRLKPSSQGRADWLVRNCNCLAWGSKARNALVPGVEGGILVRTLGVPFVSSVHSKSLKDSD